MVLYRASVISSKQGSGKATKNSSLGMRKCKKNELRTTVVVAWVVIMLVIHATTEHRVLTKSWVLGSFLNPSSAKEQHTGPPPFRMLLGIFTTDSTKERARQTMIQNTYLSLPKFIARYNVTTVPLRTSRVCSLYEFWYGNMTERDECQLLYTWVMGGAKKSDPNASTEYLHLQADRPMTITTPSSDPNTTYLNIIENMNEGKSQTWFKYASSQIPDDLRIDLVAKVDTDCLLYPTILLSEIERLCEEMKLSYPLHSSYGGSRQQGNDRSYMQGGFYFLSQDVAQYITSDQCDRERIIEEYKPMYKDERAEDVEISRFVLSYPRHVHELEIPRHKAYFHAKKLKDAEHFKDYWKWYMATIVANDRIAKVQISYNSLCPPEIALNQEKNLISKDLIRVRQQFEILRKQLPC